MATEKDPSTECWLWDEETGDRLACCCEHMNCPHVAYDEAWGLEEESASITE